VVCEAGEKRVRAWTLTGTISGVDIECLHSHISLLEDLQVQHAHSQEFNGKLLVWFHPHRGDRSAQRWLKRRLKKTFPRADFFMPRYLGEIDAEVLSKLAVELLLLVASIHATAIRESRPYQEVVIVAYGEGILAARKMLEFSTDSRDYFDDPALDTLIRENWSEISANCRTVYIARGQAGSQLRQQLGHAAGQAGSWWRNLAARLAERVSR
jgi:hypothetical protein